MPNRISGAVTVTLDGSGKGSAQLGPQNTAYGWHVLRMTTNGTGATQPKLTVTRGSATGPMIDQTLLGNGDVSSDNPYDLQPGEYVTVSYTGGTAGATCSFYLEGLELH